MRAGWRWGRRSRPTWRAAWRSSCCRSGLIHCRIQTCIITHLVTITHMSVCVTGSVKATRGGSGGEPASGEHVLDRLPHCTLPVHTLTRHSEEPRCSDYLAGHLQWHQSHHNNSGTSHRGAPQTLLRWKSQSLFAVTNQFCVRVFAGSVSLWTSWKGCGLKVSWLIGLWSC